MPIITLTTDFGLEDWFVGAVKGVIWDRCSDARVVDLTHGVPPGDVRAGAFALMAGTRCFKHGAIHMAVVDPGVGSERSAVAIQTSLAIYVGPDNGLLSWAVDRDGGGVARRITNSDLFLLRTSRTFHGRDVFAPVTAFLAAGGPFEAVGPLETAWQQLPWPAPVRSEAGWLGEVLYVDRFGNGITNLAEDTCGEPSGGGSRRVSVRVRVGNASGVVAACYAGTPHGAAFGAVFGSTGYLEIAVPGGNAAERLGLRAGVRVVLES